MEDHRLSSRKCSEDSDDESVERECLQGTPAQRMQNYVKNFHDLEYIEEEKHEKDSWGKMSQVA